MPIIKKPRQIRIELDPDEGFPTRIVLESTSYVEENGVKVADLIPQAESFAPDSDEAIAIFGEATASAMAALIPYQKEVQRLALELEASLLKIPDDQT